jgi:hypothetical protein
MVKLQVHTTMPFIIQQQLHMPPANIVQRFCIMAAAVLSSHEQVIFMPPLTFSIFMVQRGTIIQLTAAGIPVPTPIAGAPMAGMLPIPIPVRSIIMLDITGSFRGGVASILPHAGEALEARPSGFFGNQIIATEFADCNEAKEKNDPKDQIVSLLAHLSP